MWFAVQMHIVLETNYHILVVEPKERIDLFFVVSVGNIYT